MAGADVVVSRLRILVEMDSKGTKGQSSKLGKGIGKLTGPALAAGAAVAGLAVKAGRSASRLQQSQGAVESVFGKSAGQIEAWAQAADQSVGLSESSYGELASVIGAQLKNIGVPMDQVAGKTNDLIEMGADLSATYGGTTADAVAALGSALRGETDPIEKYGIAIKQSTIEAKVGKKNLDAMSEAEKKSAKTTALLGLVTEQAGGAVGAFGREADTASGQQQRANAAWEDASAHLGGTLLPLMTSMAKALAGVAGWVDRNRALTITLVSVIASLAAVILGINMGMRAYTAATKAQAAMQAFMTKQTITTRLGLAALYVQTLAVTAATKAQAAMTKALTLTMTIYNAVTKTVAAASRAMWASTLGPIILVVAAVLAIVAVLVIAYKKVGWFKRGVDAIWRGIVIAAKAAWKVIGAIVGIAIKLISAYIRGYAKIVSLIFKAGVAVVRAVWSAISNIVRTTVNTVKNIIHTVADKVRSVMDSAKRIWDSIFDKLPGPVKAAIKAATAPFDLMVDAISSVIGWVQRLIDKIRKISWPKPPGWVSKIIPGGNSATTAGVSVAAGTASADGRLVGVRAASASAGAGVQIVIQGALDPVAVAAQIKRIIRNDDQRRGVVIMGGRLAAGTG